MRIRLQPFVLATALVVVAALNALAQSRPNGVPVPIKGTSSTGGTFSGTLLIRNFTTSGSGIAGTGTANGVLTEGGIARQVVSDQIGLAVDLALTRARRNTELALASAPCELVHLDFASGVLRALGSTVTLDRSSVDITTGASSPSTTQSVSSSTSASTTTALSSAALPSTMLSTGSTSTVAVSAGSPIPGTISAPVPVAVQPSDLGGLLCSASRLGDTAADRSQLVQLLNQIVQLL